MRALVMSDSHSRDEIITKILKTVKNYDVVVFLGDGERDIYTAENSELIAFKKLIAVAGNCDFGSYLPTEETFEMKGKKIFCLHGHTLGVKHGFAMLENKAQLMSADVAVHGHTHEQRVDYRDGIWYMCPGAVKDGEYGIIDVDEKTNSVICYTCNLFCP